MNSSPNDQAHVEPAADGARKSAERRRRLMLGGVSAPLLMTIASRPAWANGDTCTPSALASANLSGQHTQGGCGKSAGFWSQKQYAWPESVSPATRFGDIFTVTTISKGRTAFNFADLTLGEVIVLPGNENPYKLGLHAVGALVNSYAFPTNNIDNPGFPYTPEQVIAMFNASAGSDPEGLASLFEHANNDYDALSSWPH